MNGCPNKNEMKASMHTDILNGFDGTSKEKPKSFIEIKRNISANQIGELLGEADAETCAEFLNGIAYGNNEKFIDKVRAKMQTFETDHIHVRSKKRI